MSTGWDDDSAFVTYDEEPPESLEPQSEEASSGSDHSAAGGRRRLGRAATPRLALGLVLLGLLAVVVWWGVQTILLPPVATATPTAMVTLAILPPATSAPTPMATIAMASPEPLVTDVRPEESFAIGAQVRVVDTGGTGGRFRAGPGTNFLTLAILEDGTQLTVVEGPEDADARLWYRLEMEDGTVGWMAQELLLGD